MTTDLNTQHRCLKNSAKNGTSSVTSSPKYPKSNRFVEGHIQIVKKLLTKAKQSGKDPHLGMLESRNCPVENSSSPAQLIYGRYLRSLLPIYHEKLKIK